ncbi:MAG: hypothetical protein JW832_03830, partial [Deltaproteobacteria bacterium]|nr:hypothetical protein [Deltaproteobacteria bacterium]
GGGGATSLFRDDSLSLAYGLLLNFLKVFMPRLRSTCHHRTIVRQNKSPHMTMLIPITPLKSIFDGHIAGVQNFGPLQNNQGAHKSSLCG